MINKDELRLMNMLGRSITTTHTISQNTYSKLGDASKWFLGGALAICYGIFSDPEKMYSLYNPFFMKLTFLCMLASMFFGIRFIFGHHLYYSLDSDGSLKNSLELDEAISNHEMEDDKEPVVKMSETEMIKKTGEKLASMICMKLKQSKFFIFQFLLLMIPLFGIVIQLLFIL
jgi:hypothetical protein